MKTIESYVSESVMLLIRCVKGDSLGVLRTILISTPQSLDRVR